MGKIKAFMVLAGFIGLIYMHVNGYENRAHRNFEPLPDQAGEMQAEIPDDQPLWFRNMNDSNSPIAVVTNNNCWHGEACASITIDLQDRADFIVKQSTVYKIKLTPEEPVHEAGPFTVQLSPDNRPLISWNADQLKRGIKTDQVVNEAGIH